MTDSIHCNLGEALSLSSQWHKLEIPPWHQSFTDCKELAP